MSEPYKPRKFCPYCPLLVRCIGQEMRVTLARCAVCHLPIGIPINQDGPILGTSHTREAQSNIGKVYPLGILSMRGCPRVQVTVQGTRLSKYSYGVCLDCFENIETTRRAKDRC